MQRQNEPITEGLATVLPIETNEVFYNPAQVFNRDLSILAISVKVAKRRYRRLNSNMPPTSNLLGWVVLVIKNVAQFEVRLG